MGSTNALTDSSGNILSSTAYDSYGNTTASLGTRYQYTGREKDDVTGLIYYRARWYESNLGRFLSEDPIGLNGGINQFGYVGANPLSFRDPSGKIPVVIPIVIGVGLLIATSPSYVNAPGENDPVYLDDKGSGVFINAAGGVACGVAFRVASPYVGKLLSKIAIGDDIIELGISRHNPVNGKINIGGKYETPDMTNLNLMLDTTDRDIPNLLRGMVIILIGYSIQNPLTKFTLLCCLAVLLIPKE